MHIFHPIFFNAAQLNFGYFSSYEKFNWIISSPESKNVSSKSLKKLDQEFKKGHHGYIDSFIVIKENVIVFEEYY